MASIEKNDRSPASIQIFTSDTLVINSNDRNGVTRAIQDFQGKFTIFAIEKTKITDHECYI